MRNKPYIAFPPLSVSLAALWLRVSSPGGVVMEALHSGIPPDGEML